MPATANPIGEISATSAYTLDEAQRRSRCGAASFRRMRAMGLPVYYHGRTAFVFGSDLLKFIREHGKDEHPGGPGRWPKGSKREDVA